MKGNLIAVVRYIYDDITGNVDKEPIILLLWSICYFLTAIMGSALAVISISSDPEYYKHGYFYWFAGMGVLCLLIFIKQRINLGKRIEKDDKRS